MAEFRFVIHLLHDPRPSQPGNADTAELMLTTGTGLVKDRTVNGTFASDCTSWAFASESGAEGERRTQAREELVGVGERVGVERTEPVGEFHGEVGEPEAVGLVAERTGRPMALQPASAERGGS